MTLQKMCLPILLLFIFNVSRAQQNISGKITDPEGLPVNGATVNLKGTKVSTTTNVQGMFLITVPANAGNVLVVSNVGFETKEVGIKNGTVFNIQLVQVEAVLKDVVIVGYGTQRKSQLTGAISSISAKEISELPISNTQQALQGRVAGIDVINSSNRPGSEPRVTIRGRRSFNAGNEPLYVVDGIPLGGGIGDINPQDIQSIEVLKDASATAIYGSRGANGVIIVTTKRGRNGKTVVSYDAYVGVSRSLGRIDVMNGAQFAEFKRESRRTTGNYPDIATDDADKKLFEAVELESIRLGRSTDYQALLLRNSLQQSHQIGISGGTEKTQFAISTNVFNEKGIIYNQSFTRYTLRLNLDHQINERIKIGTSILIANGIRNGQNFNPISGALQENPLGIPYDANGNLIFLPTTDGLRTNPLAEIVPGAIVDESRRIRVFTSLFTEVKIAKGLTYRLNFGPDFRNERYGQFTGSQTNARRGGNPTARTQNFSNFNYTWENILNYKNVFRQIHSIDITALHSIQSSRDEYFDARVNSVPAEPQLFYNIGAAAIVDGVGSNLTVSGLQSYMGRINYGLKEKYLLTLTGRLDGSSRLAVGNKYSFFPSVALGWNISSEKFMSNVSFVNKLKLRVSYGNTGNQAIRPYQTLGSLLRTTYAFGASGAFGYRPNEIPNPNLKWEKSGTTNIGLDFTLFSNRIYGSFELYKTNTKDLLLSRQLPITGGFGSITENIGATRNHGIELNVSTVNIRNKNFKWTTDFNVFANKEEIVELYNGKSDDIGNGWFIGKPLTVYYDYEKTGIWQTGDKDLATTFSQKPGEIRVKDQNGDGKITSDDRVILGSDVPKWSGGITNRFEYRGFDLNIFVYARIGATIRSRFHDNNNQLFGRYNNLNINYWTPNNPTNDFPRPNQNQEFPIYGSTLSYFNGSFVKIRNISLGYNFTTALAEKMKMKSLRVYMNVQQPFIFATYRSKYKGIDPEGNRELSGDTPATSLFTFGVNAKF
jgi:TonB-linked SusC/RagA family outer membrane protein